MQIYSPCMYHPKSMSHAKSHKKKVYDVLRHHPNHHESNIAIVLKKVQPGSFNRQVCGVGKEKMDNYFVQRLGEGIELKLLQAHTHSHNNGENKHKD